MMFRFKALQRMREPDELDSPTLLAAPRGWIALFVVLITMAAALIWAFAGQLRVTVNAPGLLTRPGGTARVQSPYNGTVHRLFAHPADAVTSGQPVAEIRDADGRTRKITSPFAGRVVGLAVSDGQVVTTGTSLFTVERTDGPGDRMVAMVFVPSDRAAMLAPGTRVDLAVSTAPPAAFGLLRGKVSSVSPYPLTQEAITGLVGGELAAKRYTGQSAPRLVVVDLIPDKDTRTGYAWSTTSGPPTELGSQVSVAATINLGSQTPFDLVLGR
ncbi:HlyD family efflux transporter periplasmic adaptor subunit [Streptomyces sp. NPDC005408]|uniref:HlyD family efflux transporter periplasmic adaptor subunit n=1 Tax=Streptomyces sp. NPDC005408 TaxID=3155341 RepID=UPI0033BA2018